MNRWVTLPETAQFPTVRANGHIPAAPTQGLEFPRPARIPLDLSVPVPGYLPAPVSLAGVERRLALLAAGSGVDTGLSAALVGLARTRQLRFKRNVQPGFATAALLGASALTSRRNEREGRNVNPWTGD